jgi:hypothetical protein
MMRVPAGMGWVAKSPFLMVGLPVSGLLLLGKARSSKCARTGTWMSGAVMTLDGLDCSGVQEGKDCRMVDKVPFSESVCDEQSLAASDIKGQ